MKTYIHDTSFMMIIYKTDREREREGKKKREKEIKRKNIIEIKRQTGLVRRTGHSLCS